MDFFGNQQQEISVGTIDFIRCHGSKARKYDRDSISFIPKRFNAQEMGHHYMQLALTWRLDMSLKMDENDVSLLFGLQSSHNLYLPKVPSPSHQSSINGKPQPSPWVGLGIFRSTRTVEKYLPTREGKFQTFRDPEIQNAHKSNTSPIY